MTEVQNALYSPVFHMFDDPLQVLGLQIGNTHMPHDTLLAQFHEGRQGLVAHFLQPAFHTSLKLDVMHIDKVNIVYVQTLHTLIDTVCDASGAVVPGVHTVLAIASYFRREEIFVARNFLQGFTQYDLCLQVPIIRRHIDKVNTIIYCRMYGTDAFFLTDTMKHAAQ